MSVPDWIADEIKNSLWKFIEELKRSGYVLSVAQKGKTMDAQFYDPLTDGRHIATLDLIDSLSDETFINGDEYIFLIKVYKSNLSEKVAAFLSKEYSLEMNEIYRFELISVESLNER